MNRLASKFNSAKMKSIVSCLLLGLALLFYSSCHKPDPKVIAKIDALLISLDSIHTKVGSLNFKQEETQSQKIREDLDFIQNNFRDTLTQDFGFVLSDYRAMVDGEENKSNNENLEKMLKKELDYSKLQVLNLKHDFEKSEMPEEDFKKFFETESLAVNKLSNYVTKKQLEFERKLKQFETLQPKVQNFIDSLKK
jgi:hypothetical protein